MPGRLEEIHAALFQVSCQLAGQLVELAGSHEQVKRHEDLYQIWFDLNEQIEAIDTFANGVSPCKQQRKHV